MTPEGLEPPGEQLLELPLRLAASFGDEWVGVVFREVPGEQEQSGQVDGAARELVEGLGWRAEIDSPAEPEELV